MKSTNIKFQIGATQEKFFINSFWKFVFITSCLLMITDFVYPKAANAYESKVCKHFNSIMNDSIERSDSLHLTYFHLNNLEISSDFGVALMPIEEYVNDPLKNFRSPRTEYIIGVLFKSSGFHYIFEVELDAEMEITGGQWHCENVPDFMMIPFNKI